MLKLSGGWVWVWSGLVDGWFTRSGDFKFFPLLSHPNVSSCHFQFTMSFIKVYSDVLTPFVVKYKEAKNEKGRAAILKNAADAVLESKNLLEDNGGALPKDLKGVRFILFSVNFR